MSNLQKFDRWTTAGRRKTAHPRGCVGSLKRGTLEWQPSDDLVYSREPWRSPTRVLKRV